MKYLPILRTSLRAGLVGVALLALACSGGRRGGRPPATDSGPTADGGGTPTDGGGASDGGGADGGPAVDGGSTDAGGGMDAGGDTDAGGGTDAGTDAGGGLDAGTDAGPTGDTIRDIQQGLISEGTTVSIYGVVVTGLYSVGMWVQDPSGGAMHSGIRVYTGSAPTVSVGDLVDVEGDVLEYYGETEIEFATVTDRGATTPITPTPLTVAAARNEAYEGVLVELTDISSTVYPYDCSVDDVGCSDANLWEVRSGTVGILVYDYVYEDSDWLSRVEETPVTGIMAWRYARRRILPRTAADFGI